MATAYLSQQITSGTAQLLRTINATPSNLGTAAGTIVTYVTTAHALTNLAVYWQGVLYKLTATGVHRSRDDGQTWTTVLTLTGVVPVASNNVLAGPYVLYNDGVPRLLIVYTSTANLYRYAWSADGVSWTDVSTGITGGPNIGCFPVVYRSTLLFGNENTSQVYQINPFAATVATINCAATCPFMTYLCVWNDVPYVTGRLGTTWVLTSLAGGSPANVLTIDAAAFPNNPHVMWVDPTTNNLIALGGPTGNPWRAYEITPGLVNTPRSTDMITGTPLASFTGSCKVAGIFYDQEANPGGPPNIYFMIASSNVSSTAVAMFQYNGATLKMGNNPAGPTSAANDSGGTIAYAWVDKNIAGERFFTPRPVGVDGTAEIAATGKGSPGAGTMRRKFKLFKPRSQVLTTTGGPGTYDLAGTPLSSTPVQAGSVTIRGVIGAVTQIAQDDGAGNFPISTLLPAGGTIVYATGAMTGTTAVLDGATNVEALYIGGTATNRWYVAAAANEYPGSVAKATLTSPTSGTISSNDNINCLANGSEQQVSVDVSSFTAGDVIGILPRAL